MYLLMRCFNGHYLQWCPEPNYTNLACLITSSCCITHHSLHAGNQPGPWTHSRIHSQTKEPWSIFDFINQYLPCGEKYIHHTWLGRTSLTTHTNTILSQQRPSHLNARGTPVVVRQDWMHQRVLWTSERINGCKGHMTSCWYISQFKKTSKELMDNKMPVAS